MQPIAGIHHVTAISGPAQPNVDFYAGFLGLRLVKTTVNFDDPGTHHLYFGDETGSPGTIVTFFPWEHSLRGARGSGQTYDILFAVPRHSLPYWEERAVRYGVVAETGTLFDDATLSFEDPDGMAIVLVAPEDEDSEPTWKDSPVPPHASVRRVLGVTLKEAEFSETGAFLTGLMGGDLYAESNGRRRYSVGRSYVDVIEDPNSSRGRMGSGAIHHVAFRAKDGADQREWRSHIIEAKRHVSPVMDRTYFTSIYFHEPGGVLFEIATDGPGFTFDEPVETLGTRLMLPAWLEEDRRAIEATLPKLNVPVEVR